jgi:DNA-directed RNA polymerase specialized sigma24 family protein
MSAKMTSLTPEISSRAIFLLAAGDLENNKARVAFARYYERPIQAWYRRWWPEQADQDEIARTILGRLFEMLPIFKHDSNNTFRDLLRTMIRDAIIDLNRRRQPAAHSHCDTRALDGLYSRPAVNNSSVDDLMQELAGPMARDQQLYAACERVHLRVEQHTWKAFLFTTVDGRPVTEVARYLGMRERTIGVYKCRVMKMIESEIEAIAG